VFPPTKFKNNSDIHNYETPTTNRTTRCKREFKRCHSFGFNYEFLEKDRTAGIVNEENYRTKLAQSTKALIDCLKIEPCPTSPNEDNQELVDILLEKRQYFQVEYNITADTTKKFELKKRIEEIELELGQYQ